MRPLLTMVVNASISLESQPVMDGGIVSIPLVIVGKASCQMGRDEANLRISKIQPDGDGAFVAGHSRHSSLLDTPFNILDEAQHRCLNKDAQSRANELPAPEKYIWVSADGPRIIIKSFLH